MTIFKKILIITFLLSPFFNQILSQEGEHVVEPADGQEEGQGPEEDGQKPPEVPSVPPVIGPGSPTTGPSEPVSGGQESTQTQGTTVPIVTPTTSGGGETVPVQPPAAPISQDVLNTIGAGTAKLQTFTNISAAQLEDPSNAQALANEVTKPGFQKIVSSPSYTDALSSFALNLIDSLATAVKTTTSSTISLITMLNILLGAVSFSAGKTGSPSGLAIAGKIVTRDPAALDKILEAADAGASTTSTNRADLLNIAMIFIQEKAASGDLSFINKPGTNTEGMTVLKLAVELGNNDAIKSLLQTYHADPNAGVSSNYQSALSLAAEKGNADGIKLLIDAGANVNQVLNRRIPEKNEIETTSTALFYATQSGNPQAVALLLEHHADPNLGASPLSQAVRNNNVAIATALLNAGANVDVKDFTISTPLMNAVQNGLDMVNVLLQHGANAAGQDYVGKTVLNYVDPSKPGAVGIAQRLIDAGANVNAQDPAGTTPLMYWANAGNIDMINLLLKNKADPTMANKAGSTALSSIDGSKPNAQNIATSLLDAGANVNSQDQKGTTPLMTAAQSGNLGLVMLLIKRGANAAMTDNLGYTAEQYAYKAPTRTQQESNNQQNIVNLLRSLSQTQMQTSGQTPQPPAQSQTGGGLP